MTIQQNLILIDKIYISFIPDFYCHFIELQANIFEFLPDWYVFSNLIYDNLIFKQSCNELKFFPHCG